MKGRNSLKVGIIVLLATVFVFMVGSNGICDPKYGGKVRIAIPKDTASLGDILKIFRVDMMLFALPCVETLIRFDDKGFPAPLLAERWKESPESKSITLFLRKGVKFHDGTDFNAEAVKFNFDRYINAKRAELRIVEKVEIVDPYTVRLVLSEWDNALLANFASYPGFMVSPASFKTHDEVWVANNPVGTGPFKFKKWTKGVGMQYEKFEGYWQKGKPYLDGMDFVIITDPMTRIAAFKAKEVDAVLNLDAKEVRELKGSGEAETATCPRSFFNFVPDSVHEKSPFADIRVRRAVDYAIDRKAIVDNITGGLWEAINQPASPRMWEYNPKVVGYPYNPAKAKALLAEAGFPNGFKTTINLPSMDADLISATTAVQGYLKNVGIDAKIELLEISKYLETGMKGWEGLHYGGGAIIVPDQLSNLKRVYSGFSTVQASVSKPPKIDELIVKGLAAPDFNTKKAIAHEVMKLYTDEYCSILWLGIVTDASAWQKYVRDLGLNKVVAYLFTPEDAWLNK